MDNTQLTAAVDALCLDKPTAQDYRLAVRCIVRLLGPEHCAEILAALGLS